MYFCIVFVIVNSRLARVIAIASCRQRPMFPHCQDWRLAQVKIIYIRQYNMKSYYDEKLSHYILYIQFFFNISYCLYHPRFTTSFKGFR